jgi:chromosome segregation ATPase
VILAMTAYFNPSVNDTKRPAEGKREQSKLFEQVRELRLEIRQISEICASTQIQLRQLKEKGSFVPDESLLEEQLTHGQSQIDELRQDNLRLCQQLERLNLLAKENEHLNNQVIKLSLDVKDLEKEKEKQAKVISGLNAKKKYLQTQLKKTKTDLDETSKELAQTRRSESDLQKSLSKHKTLLSDSEKENEHLRVKNEELRDGLIYEINN